MQNQVPETLRQGVEVFDQAHFGVGPCEAVREFQEWKRGYQEPQVLRLHRLGNSAQQEGAGSLEASQV